MGLQDLCKEVVEQLEKFNFLEHIRGKAGRLEDEEKQHYRAIFLFKPKNEGKIYELRGFLAEKYYETQFSFEQYIVDNISTGVWRIVLVADRGKPSEQETNLIHSLYSLKKYLSEYK